MRVEGSLNCFITLDVPTDGIETLCGVSAWKGKTNDSYGKVEELARPPNLNKTYRVQSGKQKGETQYQLVDTPELGFALQRRPARTEQDESYGWEQSQRDYPS